jgi:hypothetical protein
MSIVTRGYIEDQIITRGYAGKITETMRDIARLVSRIFKTVTLKSKMDLEEDSV